jgi:hypothetical protein
MPALKVYFQKYLDALGSTIESVRQRRTNDATYGSSVEKRMTRSGTYTYSGKNTNPKTSTKYIDTISEPDLELAAINVTSEVDAASMHGHSHDPSRIYPSDHMPPSSNSLNRDIAWREDISFESSPVSTKSRI